MEWRASRLQCSGQIVAWGFFSQVCVCVCVQLENESRRLHDFFAIWKWTYDSFMAQKEMMLFFPRPTFSGVESAQVKGRPQSY